LFRHFDSKQVLPHTSGSVIIQAICIDSIFGILWIFKTVEAEQRMFAGAGKDAVTMLE